MKDLIRSFSAVLCALTLLTSPGCSVEESEVDMEIDVDINTRSPKPAKPEAEQQQPSPNLLADPGNRETAALCGATQDVRTITRVPGGKHSVVYVVYDGRQYKLAMPSRSYDLCDDQRFNELNRYVQMGGEPHIFFCSSCQQWMIGVDRSWDCCQKILGPHQHAH